jgi:cell division protein FtsB
MSTLRLNLIAAVLLGVLVFSQYRLWFESGGILDLFKLKKTLSVQMHENDTLKKNNDNLLLQIQQLRGSRDEVESKARTELGMMKQDETFYQLVK